jgi:hypothetical protein
MIAENFRVISRDGDIKDSVIDVSVPQWHQQKYHLILAHRKPRTKHSWTGSGSQRFMRTGLNIKSQTRISPKRAINSGWSASLHRQRGLSVAVCTKQRYANMVNNERFMIGEGAIESGAAKHCSVHAPAMVPCPFSWPFTCGVSAPRKNLPIPPLGEQNHPGWPLPPDYRKMTGGWSSQSLLNCCIRDSSSHKIIWLVWDWLSCSRRGDRYLWMPPDAKVVHT